MQKIIPNLWFDNQIDEAVQFYLQAFSNSEITFTSNYPSQGLPEQQEHLAGQTLIKNFRLGDTHFTALHGGPGVEPSSALSFMVNFDPATDPQAREHLDQTWQRLSQHAKVVMPLREYPFSPHYGWLQDLYGFNWQLILTNPAGEPRPFIIPSLMFSGPVQNQAEQAIQFYTSVFADSRLGNAHPYGQARGPAKADSLMFADFQLANQWFAANDSGTPQERSFTESVSLLVNCADQAEIDRLWQALSAHPENELCGWLKDKFGVSWQLVPQDMDQRMCGLNGEPRLETYHAMMGMKKLVIADLAL